MGKIFLTISLIFLSFRGFGQWGDVNQPIDVTGSITWNCVVNLAGYDNAPTLVFIPGSGEIGASNGLDTNNVYVNGPQRMMKYGWKGYVLGQRWNIITLQPTNSSTTLSYHMRAIDTIIARYNIDTCRLYITGLSLGASLVARYISTYTNANPWKFAAAVPMSIGTTSNIDSVQQLRWYAENDGHYYGLVGNSDSTGRPLTQQIYRFMQEVDPASSKLYVYSGGHDSWNTYYDTAWRNGGENIYEWLAKYSKRPYANAAQTSITTGETYVTLNGIVDSLSGGHNGVNRTITWTKQSGGSATITSPSSAVTTVTGLEEGTYVFRLTSANAAGGLSAYKDVTVNVEGEDPPDPGDDEPAKYIKKRGRKSVIKSD